MKRNIVEKMREDLESLIEKKDIFIKLIDQKNKSDLIKEYQIWYTEASVIIKKLTPHRYFEFKEFYNNIDRYQIKAFLEYTSDNPTFEDITKIKLFLEQQAAILESAKRKLDSFLMSIEDITKANLFDSELEMAETLNKNGFLRPAGVLAGVVLESHLKTLLSHRNIDLKTSKSLSEYNELLKKNKIIDTPVWRNIQFLTDIRNKCCHKKEKEPTVQDISDLIDGVKKIIKTVY